MSTPDYSDAIAEAADRDHTRLKALEREQQQLRTARPRRVTTTHRLTPIPRELHEPGGATRWLCQGCRATFNWEDDADDTVCPAMEFLFQ